MVLELLMSSKHPLVMSDVVLRDAVLCKSGNSVARCVARDTEVALKECLGLLDGFFLGGRGLAVVVVTTHENEELGPFGLLRAANLDVGVEENSESALGVVLLGYRAGDEVAETRGLEVFVGIPD